VQSPLVESVVVVHRSSRRGQPAEPDVPGITHASGRLPEVDVTVIAASSGERRLAEDALALGSHVVCATDDPAEVRALLGLDRRAAALQRVIAVGATMAPGLSCLLASRMRSDFDRVDEVHVASFGTGGPGCARRHHAALRGVVTDWDDGVWRRRPGGSGRELVWFPEPVGGADCYRAALPDAVLLVPAFPEARRVTSRLQATRRDRITSFLPMMRRPHPEGRNGAVRVELRGWVGGRAETKVLGAAARPAGVAAVVATQVALAAADTGTFTRFGAGGLAELVRSPGALLGAVCEAGVTIWQFEGS